MSPETAEQIEARYGICGQIYDYKLIPVFRNTTSETRKLIVDFWKSNRALPANADAEERAKQVVIMVIGPDSKPVAVSTVYRDDFAHTGMKNAPSGPFYFFRTFVQRSDQAHHLSKKITACTYDHIKTFSEPDKPQGIIIVAENAKFSKPMLDRLIGVLGWTHIGQDPRGKLVYRRDF